MDSFIIIFIIFFFSTTRCFLAVGNCCNAIDRRCHNCNRICRNIPGYPRSDRFNRKIHGFILCERNSSQSLELNSFHLICCRNCKNCACSQYCAISRRNRHCSSCCYSFFSCHSCFSTMQIHPIAPRIFRKRNHQAANKIELYKLRYFDGRRHGKIIWEITFHIRYIRRKVPHHPLLYLVRITF